MYREIFIPSKKTHNVAIPREWYGTEIEVIAFPTREVTPNLLDKTRTQKVSLQVAEKEDIQEISKIFEKYLFPMNGFKFNRDEANNYE